MASSQQSHRSSNGDEDYSVPVDQALKRLEVIPDYDAGNGPGPCVHTFAQSRIGLLGAHWDLPAVEAFMREHGVETSGPEATATGHGLVTVGDGRTIFFATRRDDDEHGKPGPAR